VKIHSKTDIGKARHSNQDAFFVGELENGAVFAIVCDGMGGANAGNVASETAVKVISEYVLRSYRIGMDGYKIEKMLQNAIESANIDIYEMASANTDLEGMGTTAVIALVDNSVAVIAHVGDSRAYLVNDKLIQLTKDHSIVQSLIESGKITPEDAKVHPRKNVITRALGAEKDVVADTVQIEFPEGQTLLLCTDGLSSFAESEDILQAFKQNDSTEVPQKLVDLANKGGGGDNITVVTITS